MSDFRHDDDQYVLYEDANYYYHCMADPRAALTDPRWKIAREALDGTRVVWLDGGTYGYAATDLATVAAYSY